MVCFQNWIRKLASLNPLLTPLLPLIAETKGSDFGWEERYRAAVGVAQALDYLHGNGNDQPVIHRDVKSSNILLSSDFEPKVDLILTLLVQ